MVAAAPKAKTEHGTQTRKINFFLNSAAIFGRRTTPIFLNDLFAYIESALGCLSDYS